MTDKNLLILSDPPAAVIAGSGTEYGFIEFDSISLAASLANRAFKRVDQARDDPDTIQSLRESVNNLSDALNAVSGQLMQLERGIASGRIAVAPRD